MIVRDTDIANRLFQSWYSSRRYAVSYRQSCGKEAWVLLYVHRSFCKDFGLSISLKKTNILGQDTNELPAITIDDYELDVIEQFTYLGSTITNNLSLDTEIDKRIGQAATTLARLTSRVWTNPKLTVKTKMVVYNASLGRVGIWKKNQRLPTAALQLQGCLQERHESTWHQHRVLGRLCSRPHDVEKYSEPTSQDRGRDAGECRNRRKGMQKGVQQLQQTRDHTQMWLLWQRLFLPHLSLQPQATLQQSNRQDNQDVLTWSNLIIGGHSSRSFSEAGCHRVGFYVKWVVKVVRHLSFECQLSARLKSCRWNTEPSNW